mmetsp:Transcript_17300/g.32536  ORF Transcript_17300/g.32536 Transcript_17300/m.32536 type:complete len:590 (-) Transcript_17300:27-1796(-)
MPARSREVRRVSEEEVRRRWVGLTLEQRQAVTRFEDAALISRIRDALHALREKNALMRQMGIRLGGDAEFNMLAVSPFFMECFELPFKVAKSEECPDIMIMDPDDQPSLMMVRAEILEGEKIFECFRTVLPDFLTCQRLRAPMPRARWKDLWMSEPSSVASLEGQLAKLVEQALWAMGSDPAFQVVEVTPEAAVDDVVLFESWMAEPDKGDSKKKKKKKKRAVGAPEVCLEDASDVAAKTIEDAAELPAEPAEETAEAAGEIAQASEDSAAEVIAVIAEVSGDSAEALQELPDEASGDAVQASGEATEEAEEVPSGASEATEKSAAVAEVLGVQDVTKGPEAPGEVEPRQHPKARQEARNEHYWGTLGCRARGPGTLNQKCRERWLASAAAADSRRAAPPKASAASSSEEPAFPSEEAPREDWASSLSSLQSVRGCWVSGDFPVSQGPSCTPPPSPIEPPHRAWNPQQLVGYIWNQTSQLPRSFSNSKVSAQGGSKTTTSPTSTPATALPASSCTPSSPWSRGYWATTPDGLPAGGIQVVVRNTFIEIDEPSLVEHTATRSSRSLSPSLLKAQECPASIAALSTNYWHR